jgi:hypothetical protein
MPEKYQGPPPGVTATPIDQLLREANVPTAPAPQVKAAPAPVTSPPKNGAAFMDQSGRMMYRYEMNGEVIILPKPVEQMKEQDFYDLPISLYDSMPGRLPQDLTVKFKDPQWAGYWFNRKARDGSRIGTAKALGFEPVHKEDLEFYAPHLSDSDGSITNYDLVLFKIHKAKLFLKYKESIDKAKLLGGIEGYKQEANRSLSPANRQQSPYFHTPQAIQEFQGIGPVTNLPTVEK